MIVALSFLAFDCCVVAVERCMRRSWYNVYGDRDTMRMTAVAQPR